MVSKVVPSICRNCLAFCPILVTVENGRPVKVMGDPEAPLYDGYSCPKGRALPEQHNDPNRLLQSLKRGDDGSRAPIASGAAIDEVTAKVAEIIRRHGPRSVALYIGTGVVTMPTGATIAAAWSQAIGSKMIFSASTIDKPAGNTSTALHGNWVAGAQSFEEADTWMIVGANPVIAKSNGAPCNNPGQRLKEAVNRGLKLIVIDPRRTETARRAHIHLQARPGEDPTLLAGLIHIILREDLYDRAFVATHAQGLEALRDAVARYTPGYAAGRAGVPEDQLLEAARTFGRGKRGGVVCATGASFSTYSNLTYYLALCLNTLCGRWAREGEKAPYPNVMMPAFTPKAQPYPPYPVFGEYQLPASGLKQNASGLPTAALPDEMLSEGEGRIRALFCLGGNPMLAWPDQAKTEAALKNLDLLVVFDYQMTPTADLAHYVIASPLSLELPAATYFIESLKYFGVSRGFSQPWAQYTPAVADMPAGSDLVDDREFFVRMAQRMDLQLNWTNLYGWGPHLESPTDTVPLDMARVPTVDELIELSCAKARVPLAEVKSHPHGHVYDEREILTAPRDPDCTVHLDLANPMMMEQLAEIHAAGVRRPDNDDPYRYLLVCRRANNFMNSVGQTLPGLTRGKRHNPAFMHPDDLRTLGIADGSMVRIRSTSGAIAALVEGDDSLRPGVIAMTHGFGGSPGSEDDDPRAAGSAVTRLVNMDERDPISGIPRMSALPVAVERWTA